MAIVLIGMVVGVIVFFLLAINVSNKSGYRSAGRGGYHPRERGDQAGYTQTRDGEDEQDASRFRPPDYLRFSSGCFAVSVVLIIAAILVVVLVVLWSIARAGGL
jgi:hypothetical protein